MKDRIRLIRDASGIPWARGFLQPELDEQWTKWSAQRADAIKLIKPDGTIVRARVNVLNGFYPDRNGNPNIEIVVNEPANDRSSGRRRRPAEVAEREELGRIVGESISFT